MEQSSLPGFRRSSRNTRQRTIVALAVLALFCILGAIGALRRTRSLSRVEPVARPAIPDEKPSPVADSIDAPRPKHPESAPAGKPLPEEQRARAAGEYRSNDPATDWAVIAATFSNWEGAEKRAHSLKGQWKECQCKVFPPKGSNGKFFVVVGMDLHRNDADRLRDEATAAGLPPDTYVTKLAAASGQ